MATKSQVPQGKALSLISSSISTLASNKIILFPLCITVFIQLLILEILYFSPRWPLKVFFDPIIRTFWPEKYLHYPSHLMLLPKLWQMVQDPLFVLISSYFVAVAIGIIAMINSGKKVRPALVIKETLSFYIHIVVAIALSLLVVKAGSWVHNLVIQRAFLIRSGSGIFYWIKRIIIDGAPYFNLLLNVIVSSLFAYVLPIIVIEKKKVFPALLQNFKMFFGSVWPTFLIVLIPSLSYILIILLFSSSFSLEETFPEMRIWILVLSVFISFAIDAVVYTAITIFYLLKKEQK